MTNLRVTEFGEKKELTRNRFSYAHPFKFFQEVIDYYYTINQMPIPFLRKRDI